MGNGRIERKREREKIEDREREKMNKKKRWSINGCLSDG